MHRAWSTYLDPPPPDEHGPGQAGVPRHSQLDRRVHDRHPSAASTVGAHSVYSQATSAQHLVPPVPPFANVRQDMSSTSLNASPNQTPLLSRSNSPPASLSINYLPSKFAPIGPRRRKGGKLIDPLIPKQGGGREAFKSNEARMPGEGDDDYDGVDVSKGLKGRKPRWNRFKWILFFSNLVFTAYSLVALIFCLITWFNVWDHADVVRVGNRTELILSTIASALGVLTSVVGWAGIFLNNRAFLASYTFMLWICFAFLVTPGYLTYKQRTFNLEGKINAQWSRDLGADGRLRIQNQLKCCGYFSPYIEATVSQTCYSRSTLPGCKKNYLTFERLVLGRWYLVAFCLVPLHIAIMVVALLCSNHITYRFGKGMMPQAYRLNMNSMALIMEQYANQLAEQYGTDVASEVLSKSRSNVNLSGFSTPR